MGISSFLSNITSAAANICAVRNSLKEELDSLSANIYIEYSRSSKGFNPGFLVFNNGKHDAFNVDIFANPALNFEPYKGNNHFHIPCLASGSSLRVSYFPQKVDHVTLIFTYEDGKGFKNKNIFINIK